MLLAIDIGNTNIKIGVFEKNNLVHSLRLSTMQGRTGDEYGLDIISQLATKGIKKEEITGAIMSSVNPNLNYTLEHACDYFLRRHGSVLLIVCCFEFFRAGCHRCQHSQGND